MDASSDGEIQPLNGPPPDPALELGYEFWEGQRALYGLPWAERRKAERKYCTDFLARLEVEDTASAGPARATQLYVARTVVRLELADRNSGQRDPNDTQEMLFQALADAEASKHPWAMFQALLHLGHFYREQEFFGQEGVLEHAEWYYKEALVYSQEQYIPGVLNLRVQEVLYWLGVVFARRTETLPQAVFMFDWASRWGPAMYSPFLEKQKCRLRMGHREALLAESELRPDMELPEIASAIATMDALGRRRKRICEAAKRGVDLARRQQDYGWRLFFNSFVERHCKPASSAPEARGDEASPAE